MKEYLTYKEMGMKLEDIQKTSYKCRCGHTVVITNKEGRAICSNCHKWVFKDKRTEFEYRIKENQIKERRNNNE